MSDRRWRITHYGLSVYFKYINRFIGYRSGVKVCPFTRSEVAQLYTDKVVKDDRCMFHPLNTYHKDFKDSESRIQFSMSEDMELFALLQICSVPRESMFFLGLDTLERLYTIFKRDEYVGKTRLEITRDFFLEVPELEEKFRKYYRCADPVSRVSDELSCMLNFIFYDFRAYKESGTMVYNIQFLMRMPLCTLIPFCMQASKYDVDLEDRYTLENRVISWKENCEYYLKKPHITWKFSKVTTLNMRSMPCVNVVIHNHSMRVIMDIISRLKTEGIIYDFKVEPKVEVDSKTSMVFKLASFRLEATADALAVKRRF